MEATTESDLVDCLGDLREEEVVLLGGGSNLVAADRGFDGTVVQIATTGIVRAIAGDTTVLTVQAGERWSDLASFAAANDLAGIECLSGIPGTVGATPIQNVGAYGQDVAGSIVSVCAFDRRSGETIEVTKSECGFGYRTSSFKINAGHMVVLSVRLSLRRSALSNPIAHEGLAEALGIRLGESAPLGEVRRAVLALRGEKGMVLDAEDHDTWSVGSFFLNPTLDSSELSALEGRIGRRLADSPDLPIQALPDGRFRPAAAWLITEAGFRKGDGNPTGIALSSKHVLALTNRGSGTTAELISLAEEIILRVKDTFGVRLQPEPVFAGCSSPSIGQR